MPGDIGADVVDQAVLDAGLTPHDVVPLLSFAEKSGRETIYRPDPEPLHALSDWVMMVEVDWSRRLGNLAQHLTTTR